MAAKDAEEARLGQAADRRWLEAQIASDRYLDPPTGLPRLRTLCQTLATRTSRTPVVILLVTIDGYEDLVRRRGHSVGERCRRQLGAALRTLLASGRADVATGAGGRFVVIGPEPDAASIALTAEVHRLVASVGVGVVDPAPTVRIAAGFAPSAAHAARMLQDDLGAGTGARARALVACEPIVATQSGRLRGLHVRRTPYRTPADTDWNPEIVAAIAGEVARWPARLAHAVGTVWVDLPGSVVASAEMHQVVHDEWLGRVLGSRLGMRVRPDTSLDLEDAAALRPLARRGVSFALAGLSTGLPDPATVDRTVFREIVVDAAIMAGAVSEADDAALAWGLVATAARHGLLTTADGVDDRARLQTAANMRVWHVEGAVFGPTHPLFGALDTWPANTDLREGDESGSDDGHTPEPTPGALARSMTLELGQWAAGLEDGDDQVRERVRRWLDEAATPAHVRRLLAAERRGRSWTLPEVSLLVALAAS